MANELNLTGRRLLDLIAIVERADGAVAAAQAQAGAARSGHDRDDLAALDAELSAALTAALSYGALLHQQRRQLEIVVQDAAGPATGERLLALAPGESLSELRRGQVAVDQALAHLRSAERALTPFALAALRQGLVDARGLLEQAATASHLYLDAYDATLERGRRPQLVALDGPAPLPPLAAEPGLERDGLA